jgi:hypothetical protein
MSESSPGDATQGEPVERPVCWSFDDTKGCAVTRQCRTTTKGRSVAAALLGVLALACLFVGPSAVTAQAGQAPAATASTARGIATPGIGQRETRGHLRALPRGGAEEHSRFAVAAERPTTAGQGSTLFAAVLGALMLVAPPVAGFHAVRDRSRPVSRRARGTRRDRAPPALAFA